MLADAIIFTFGKTATFDTVSYLAAKLEGSRRLDLKPGDTYESENLYEFTEEKVHDVDCRPLSGKKGNKTIILVPAKAIAKRALQRMEQYGRESELLLGLGYFGQFDRQSNPPGKIAVPYEIKISDELRNSITGLPRNLFPDKSIQDRLLDCVSEGEFPYTRESIHSVLGFSDPRPEIGFCGQEMESGAFVHFAHLNAKKSGVIVVSGDPETGNVSEEITIGDKKTFQYKRDLRAVEAIRFSAEAILKFISEL